MNGITDKPVCFRFSYSERADREDMSSLVFPEFYSGNPRTFKCSSSRCIEIETSGFSVDGECGLTLRREGCPGASSYIDDVLVERSLRRILLV